MSHPTHHRTFLAAIWLCLAQGCSAPSTDLCADGLCAPSASAADLSTMPDLAPLVIDLATPADMLCVSPDGPLPPWLRICRGQCIDLRTNNDHCGFCDKPCFGVLPPAAWFTCCGGTCDDLYTSTNNCGGCGKPCDPAGYTCCMGKCIPGRRCP